jgi:murein DD-endopeptidase MepM/ murein hydrolase activator NlpD
MIVRIGVGRDAAAHASGNVIVQLVSAMGYDSFWLTYRNIRQPTVKPGQRIKQGDRIAYSGYIGAGAPYLHVEFQDRNMQYHPVPIPPTICEGTCAFPSKA